MESVVAEILILCFCKMIATTSLYQQVRIATTECEAVLQAFFLERHSVIGVEVEENKGLVNATLL